MSKRKKAPPQRVDEEKRNRLTWNMGDGDQSLLIVSDDDHSLVHEQQNAQQVREWECSAQSSHSYTSSSTSLGGNNVADVPSTKRTKKITTPEKPLVMLVKTFDSPDPEPIVIKSKELYENYFVSEGDDHLKQLLQHCHAMVEIQSMTNLDDEKWKCKVGSFKVSVFQPFEVESRVGQVISIPKLETFWLYGSQIPGCSMVYYEFNESVQQSNGNAGFIWKKKIACFGGNKPMTERKVLYYQADSDLPFKILQDMYGCSQSQKLFRFVNKGFSAETGEIEVVVYLQEAGLTLVQFPSEAPSKNRIVQRAYQIVQGIMSFFYGLDPPADTFPGKKYSRKHDIKEFFENIKKIHAKSPPDLHIDVQHPTLKPVLRPYQKQGVLWMLQQERYKCEDDAEGTTSEDGVHMLYEEVTMKDGQHLYYNKHSGIFVKDKPKPVTRPPGGLLADEMGLGKTVEVLSCMLLNPRTDLPEFKPPLDVKTWVKDRVLPKKKKDDSAESNDSTKTPPYSEKIDASSEDVKDTVSDDGEDTPDSATTATLDAKLKTDLIGVVKLEESCKVAGPDDTGNVVYLMEKIGALSSKDVIIEPMVTNSDEKTVAQGTNPNDYQLTKSCSSKIGGRDTSPTVIMLTPAKHFSGGGQSLLKAQALEIQGNGSSASSVLNNTNVVLNATELKHSAQDQGVDLLTSDVIIDKGKGSSWGSAPPEAPSAVTDSPQLDNPVKTGGGEATNKPDTKDEDTIPFGDTMPEYNLDIASDKMTESTRWDFWLKRKQALLEKPKVTALQGQIEVPSPCVSLESSQESGTDSRDVPCDSVVMETSNAISFGAKSSYNQIESAQCVTDVNSSLHLDTAEITIEKGIKKRKKSRSKSMPHVLEATNNAKPKKDRHKSVDSNDKVMKAGCDMTVISPGVPNGVTGSIDEVDILENKKRKLPEKMARRKLSKYESRVPIDEIPPPKKGFLPSQKTVLQKEFFECVCGQKAVDFDSKLRVQCEKCGLWQHADCVGYDVEDPRRGDYMCPHCHVVSPRVPSGATLIISPNTICHQWVEEIHKHVKEEKLKVFVYSGVSKHRFVQPQTLANQDIVITTYETLSKEINYVDLPHSNSEKGRRLRHPKRFMAIPSPIIAVEWWRICLDEAQMVECVTTRTAEMALRLSAVNKWCVTGTPIHHDLDDLYGLLLFLGVDPYWVKHWWESMLYKPFCFGEKEPMHQAIAKVLWRTSKVDVIDQLGLPTQSEKIHWLKFSPIEEHFYRQQYEHCYKQATDMLMKWRDNRKKLSSLDRRTMHWLLHPLVSLRQACCHPQAVRGAFVNVHKTTMTMEEILTQLTKKSKNECEESHRQMVAAMNGTAAIHIIKEEFVEAVEIYRDVLRAVVEHEEKIRTDKIQQLHTLHNLDEVLTLGVEGVGRTLRDEQLKQQCKDIKEEYLAKAVAKVMSANEALAPVQENIRNLSNELEDGINWWADVIQYALAAGLDDVLVDRVKTELQDSNFGRDSTAHRFRHVRGMEYVLNGLLEQLEACHDNLTVALTEMDNEPTPASVEETVICCLRPAGEIRKTCPFCVADYNFAIYETKLFSFKEQSVFADLQEDGQYSVTTKRQGTWADSELEKVLKILASFTRHIAADENLSQYANAHLKIFDALKKEFKCLRNKWMYLRERVSAIDELNMATTRYRLRLPDEELSDPPQPNVLDRAEVDLNKIKLGGDKVLAENELKKKLGQLLYLNNLEKAHDHLEGGMNPEPCPICQKELGDEWSVMRCGHFFCMDCIQIMLNEYSFGLRRKSLKCAICRSISLHSEISYVSMKQSTNTEEGDECFQVRGDHSTKVSAIVRCLKQIQLNDPGAKALVFSTWQEVLNVIAQALRQNNIGYKSLHAQNKFQANLNSFRSDDDVSVLLLPVHSGANGLNLIEATHILLVEPILNQAQELQAIGRIHRIGQTKPTYVHRFIVKATIEEKMHGVLKSIQSSVESNNDEENNLTIGDLWSLFRRNVAEVEVEVEASHQGDEVTVSTSHDQPQTTAELDANEQVNHPSGAEGSEQLLPLEADNPEIMQSDI